MLFTPEPRQPVTYPEYCLEHATRDQWNRLRPEMTDAELREALTRAVLHCDPGCQGNTPGGLFSRVHYFVESDALRFWAVAEGETELEASKRAPDFSGVSLMNVVRELRGIWRPA